MRTYSSPTDMGRFCIGTRGNKERIMHAADWIERLALQPHPEGGWYREVYRSPEMLDEAMLPSRFDGARSISTAIYFLLMPGDVSRLHRIKQDELWHFYDGSPLQLHRIRPDGSSQSQLVGRTADSLPMAVVPAGDYFGAEVTDDGFSLVGCTVAPGFDFADFEMPSRDELYTQVPDHADLIMRLT
jgi:predicted cupin superfamily sugar epimerase